MRRSILRHFVGNREELLLATARYTVAAMDEQMPEFIRHLRSEIASGRAPLGLYPPLNNQVDWLVILDVFVAEAGRDSAVADIIEPAFHALINTVAECLQDLHPNAKSDRCRAVATGLLALRVQSRCRRRLQATYGKAEDEAIAAGILLAELGRTRLGTNPRRETSEPSNQTAPDSEYGEETEIGVND